MNNHFYLSAINIKINTIKMYKITKHQKKRNSDISLQKNIISGHKISFQTYKPSNFRLNTIFI